MDINKDILKMYNLFVLFWVLVHSFALVLKKKWFLPCGIGINLNAVVKAYTTLKKSPHAIAIIDVTCHSCFMVIH